MNIWILVKLRVYIFSSEQRTFSVLLTGLLGNSECSWGAFGILPRVVSAFAGKLQFEFSEMWNWCEVKGKAVFLLAW